MLYAIQLWVAKVSEEVNKIQEKPRVKNKIKIMWN